MNSPGNAAIKPVKDGITLRVHAHPGAKVTAWAGPYGDALKLRVAARPVEGEANKQICEFIAEFFGVAKSAVTIAQGSTGRSKLIHLLGHTETLLKRARTI